MVVVSRHGLTEIYTPTGSASPVAHVIFVHGLFGDPRKTWTGSPNISTSKSRNESRSTSPPPPNIDSDSAFEDSKGQSIEDNYDIVGDNVSQGIFWPEALLPGVLPDIRIFTWGYDADVDRFRSTASQNTIFQHAADLLSDVADLLETEDGDLPVIFVVHSLGGIIVKDALNQSSQSEGTPRLVNVATAVTSVLFLGTPHRGSASASIGKVFYQITTAATRRPNLRLLQGLEKNSETLDRVSKGFYQTLLKREIRVASFREQKETRKLFFFSTIVVDADSATIGLPTEETGSIPENHSRMTKFSSAKDVGFQRVTAQLKRWLSKFREDPHRSYDNDFEECLRSLDNGNTGLRIKNVSDSHAKTFHWLFDPEVVPFTSWAKSSSKEAPVFWIQGKPGSGKSTLMKFAMNDRRTSVNLDKSILAGFFFHDRGSREQKTLSGMLQEIMYSVLLQQASLKQFAQPIFAEICRAQRTTSPEWDLESLQSAFEAIVEQRTVSVRLCIFLDALDEHDGDNERLLDLVFRIASLQDGAIVNVKLCLASRPWADFTSRLSSCPGFRIHDQTRNDIQAYTSSRLSSESEHSTSDLDLLIGQVTNKAHGVFIWVRLVVDLLAKGLRDGSSLKVLEKRLAEMPEELKDLYAHTLRRIEPSYADEAHIMLQIALCALSPLHLDTFVNTTTLTVWNEEPESQSMHSMLLYLSSRSGGLLEAITSGARETSDTGVLLTVQFIHQTVKEYVEERRDDLGLLRKKLELGSNGYSYLLNAAVQGRGEWSDEICLDVFQYAKLVETCCHDTVLSDLIQPLASDDSKLRWWIQHSPFESYRNITSIDKIHLKNEVMLFGLAVAANLTQCFVAFDAKYDNEVATPASNFLMQIALIEPKITQSDTTRADTVKTLLDLGFSAFQRFDFEITVSKYHLGNHRLTPLQLLLFNGQEDTSIQSEEERFATIRILLENGASPDTCLRRRAFGKVSPSWDNYEEDLAIFHCARHETIEVFRLFRAHGATIPDEYKQCAYLLWRKTWFPSPMLAEVLRSLPEPESRKETDSLDQVENEEDVDEDDVKNNFIKDDFEGYSLTPALVMMAILLMSPASPMFARQPLPGSMIARAFAKAGGVAAAIGRVNMPDHRIDELMRPFARNRFENL